MEGLFAIIVPIMAAWALTVTYRCMSTDALQRMPKIFFGAMAILVAAIAIGGIVPTIVLMFELTLIVVVEILLSIGVIPSESDFLELFMKLPLDLKILTHGGRVAYRTDLSRELDSNTLCQFAAEARKLNDDTILELKSDSIPQTAFKLYRLNSGSALLTEDTAEIDLLQTRLDERRRRISTQNEILRHDHAMRSVLYRQDRERELSMRVERDLTETAEKIRNVFDELSDDEHPCTEDERIKQLNLVKLLVAYSKRKGMIALASAESDTMDPEELSLIARETMTDLRSIGVDCGILVSATNPVPIDVVNSIYDIFYDCIICTYRRANPTLMVFITQRQNATVDMSISIECGIGLDNETAVENIPLIATSTETWTAIQTEIAREIERLLDERDVQASVGLDDGLVSIKMSVDALRSEDAPLDEMAMRLSDPDEGRAAHEEAREPGEGEAIPAPGEPAEEEDGLAAEDRPLARGDRP